MRLFPGGKLRQIVAINGRKERSKESFLPLLLLPPLSSSCSLSFFQMDHLHRLSLSRKIWGWPTPYAHHFQCPYKRHAGNCTSGDRATSIHIKCIPLTDSNYIECTLPYMWDTVLCNFLNFCINRFEIATSHDFLKRRKISYVIIY